MTKPVTLLDVSAPTWVADKDLICVALKAPTCDVVIAAIADVVSDFTCASAKAAICDVLKAATSEVLSACSCSAPKALICSDFRAAI